MIFESIRLITFDCYGTLIDWESGMLAAMRPLFPKAADAELLKLYGEIEVGLESGPYLPYRQVLAQVVQEIGQRIGVNVTRDQAATFADSLTQWQPFPDTVAALQTMAKKYRLGIISNVDDDLFAETRKKFAPVEFDFVVTAQQVQAYKPSFRNFEEAIRRSGLGKEQILHAGQSLHHDVDPANKLGIKNVWVNRPSILPGSGPVIVSKAKPTYEVHGLAELAALVGALRLSSSC
jgi:2-haloacid dehalogenase